MSNPSTIRQYQDHGPRGHRRVLDQPLVSWEGRHDDSDERDPVTFRVTVDANSESLELLLSGGDGSSDARVALEIDEGVVRLRIDGPQDDDGLLSIHLPNGRAVCQTTQSGVTRRAPDASDTPFEAAPCAHSVVFAPVSAL